MEENYFDPKPDNWPCDNWEKGKRVVENGLPKRTPSLASQTISCYGHAEFKNFPFLFL